MTRQAYQPAVNKKGEFNKERIYYLMHASPGSLSEGEFAELAEAYATLAHQEDYTALADFLECCYEYDTEEATRN